MAAAAKGGFWSHVCNPEDVLQSGKLIVWSNNCFSQCFNDVVVILAHLLFSAVTAYECSANPPVIRNLPKNWRLKSRTLLSGILVASPMCYLLVVQMIMGVSLSPMRYVSLAYVILSWCFHLWAYLRDKRKGEYPVTFTCTLCLISYMLCMWSQFKHTPEPDEVVMYHTERGTTVISVVACLVYTCLSVRLWTRAPSPPPERIVLSTDDGDINSGRYIRFLGASHRDVEEDVALGAADDPGITCASRLTFWWVGRMMRRGYAGRLTTPSDLYDLPAPLTAECVAYRMNVNNVEGSFGWTLYKMYGRRFLLLGVFKVSADALGFAGPLLLNRLVKYLERKPMEKTLSTDGYIYVALMGFFSVLGAFLSTQYGYLISRVGMQIRSTLVTGVYRKMLTVDERLVGGVDKSGGIINHMTTDADRIVNFFPSFHQFWSLPVQLIVTLYLLHQQIGAAFIAGLVFAIVLIPINKWLANKIGDISEKMMKFKDSRIQLVRELLRGIRFVKMHAWEDVFESRIVSVRRNEVDQLRWRKYLDAFCVYFWATTPVLVSTLSFVSYAVFVDDPADLTASKVFTTLALFNMLIMPLNSFPWVLNGLIEARVSLRRVQAFLRTPDFKPGGYFADTIGRNDLAVRFSSARFCWRQVCETEELLSLGNPQKAFILGPLNITIKKGMLLGVMGEVGSGKSSLLSAILGLMHRCSGAIERPNWDQPVGYVSQEPWLQRGTVRANILFGAPYEGVRYQKVVEACCLAEDFQSFPRGDLTEVGEDGATLSGGQKMRISLARAIYHQGRGAFFLLDDPISALDASVANHVFSRAIAGPLLAGETRVLATHSTHFLVHCDWVVVLGKGQIIAQGKPDDILTDAGVIKQFGDRRFLAPMSSSPNTPLVLLDGVPNIFEVQTVSSCMERVSRACEALDDSDDDVTRPGEEERVVGSVKLDTVFAYVRSCGYCMVVLILSSLAMMQISRTSTDAWLAYWVSIHKSNDTPSAWASSSTHTLLQTSSATVVSNSNGSAGAAAILSSRDLDIPSLSFAQQLMTSSAADQLRTFLIIYGSLALCNSAFTFVRAFSFAKGGLISAVRMHDGLLDMILTAPITFFDRTPLGQIINRFSTDVYTVDDSLPFIMNIFLAQLFGLIGTLILTLYGMFWIILLLLPLSLAYTSVQRYYRYTSRELKRLGSVSLSPLYSHFSETLSGLNIVRSFRVDERFFENNNCYLDGNQQTTFASLIASEWLSLRLQLIGAALSTGVALLAVIQHQRPDPTTGDATGVNAAVVGLVLSYVLSVTSLLSGVVTTFTETEREMVSVERIEQYLDIKRYNMEDFDTDEKRRFIKPPYGWPHAGWIKFVDVSLMYGTNLILKDVNFEVSPGSTLAIVGRTGAGKTSLLSALFQLTPLTTGGIFIDGVDLCRLAPSIIRSRLAIIPQDAFVFASSIRDNLDVRGERSEEQLWRALELCQLKAFVGALPQKLDTPVEERGSNFSRGQKQLLCLARAMLQNTKILCLDEATSGIDLETESIIRSTLKSAVFRGTTILTVAHRVSTVMDSDVVVVMSGGRVVEYGSPQELLENSQGHLSTLVKDASADGLVR